MEIINKTTRTLIVAAIDQAVAPGASVSVPDDVATGLLDQPDVWAAKQGYEYVTPEVDDDDKESR